MKKKCIVIASLVVCMLATGCGNSKTNSTSKSTLTATAISTETTMSDITPVSDEEIIHAKDAEDSKIEITDTFSVTSDVTDGFSIDNNTYTITKAGEYTLSGKLEDGQIIINTADTDEVTLILENTSINSTTTSPILVTNASNVTIKAEENSYNEINDLRAPSTASEDNEASNASDTSEFNQNATIYSTCDLKLAGKGALLVTAGYNNGIQSKNDISIKNITLKVNAPNNALKGNDSVEIESGEIILISTGGDGIKTVSSDLSNKGNQRGTVTISGGNIDIYSACDGIDSEYSADISGDGNLNIYTSDYSDYTGDILDKSDVNTEDADEENSSNSTNATNTETTSNSTENSNRFNRGDFNGNFGGGFGDAGNSNKSEYSSKGIKANEEIIISGATLNIFSKDDAIHTSSGVTLENGESSTGDINITGGKLNLTAADDGIHVDNILTVSDGYINIKESYEGLEGNLIYINGGSIYVASSDDCVNACAGNTTPLIQVNGGYLDVTTPSGDTDAIDSNGSYEQTGGLVVVKGGASTGSVAGSVDVEGTISVTGGTIFAFGGICEVPTDGSVNTYVMSGTSFESGTYSFTNSDGTELYGVTLNSNYSSLWLASDKLTTGSSYSLLNDGSSVSDWTQEDGVQGYDGSTGFGGGFGGGQRGDFNGIFNGETPEGFDPNNFNGDTSNRPTPPDGSTPPSRPGSSSNTNSSSSAT